jgi:hypothetical protein
MEENEDYFAEVMGRICNMTGADIAGAFFALGHAIYRYAVTSTKNADGSLDIYVTNFGATAGEHHQPILLDGPTCAVVLQTFPL